MAIDLPTRGGGPAPTINITPLVDVALVVLIIFMVVAPMLAKTFSLELPAEGGPTSAKPKDPLVLTIDSQGQVRVNQRPVPRADLASVLEPFGRQVVHVDVADDLGYGEALEILDLVKAGGSRPIAVVTKKLGANP